MLFPGHHNTQQLHVTTPMLGNRDLVLLHYDCIQFTVKIKNSGEKIYLYFKASAMG